MPGATLTEYPAKSAAAVSYEKKETEEAVRESEDHVLMLFVVTNVHRCTNAPHQPVILAPTVSVGCPISLDLPRVTGALLTARLIATMTRATTGRRLMPYTQAPRTLWQEDTCLCRETVCD